MSDKYCKLLKTYGVVTLSVQFGLKIETFVVIKLLNCVNKGLYYNYNYNFSLLVIGFPRLTNFAKIQVNFFPSGFKTHFGENKYFMY